MAKAAEVAEGAVALRRLDRHTYDIDIVGVTPLIVNRWSEKARQIMLALLGS